jgi:hypothetical protein
MGIETSIDGVDTYKYSPTTPIMSNGEVFFFWGEERPKHAPFRFLPNTEQSINLYEPAAANRFI